MEESYYLAKSDGRWEGPFAFKYILVIIDLVGLAEWLRNRKSCDVLCIIYLYVWERFDILSPCSIGSVTQAETKCISTTVVRSYALWPRPTCRGRVWRGTWPPATAWPSWRWWTWWPARCATCPCPRRPSSPLTPPGTSRPTRTRCWLSAGCPTMASCPWTTQEQSGK